LSQHPTWTEKIVPRVLRLELIGRLGGVEEVLVEVWVDLSPQTLSTFRNPVQLGAVLGTVGFQVQALQITPCGLGAKAPSHPGSQLPQSLHNFCSQVVLITSRLLGTFVFAFSLHLTRVAHTHCGLGAVSS